MNEEMLQSEMEALKNQNIYLVEMSDKLNKRFSEMGRVMLDNNKQILDKVQESVKPVKMTLKPNKSENIGDLTAALSKAQKEMGGVGKGASANRGKFASLMDIMEVTTPILEKYELATSFLVGTNEYGEYVLTMILSHKSGQWLETSAFLNDSQSQSSLPFHQKIGSAEKYMRRYMYRAMVCLAEESD